MKKIFISIILLTSSLAYADSNLYQVNVIVFEHITPLAVQAEHWPAITHMPNLANSVEPPLLNPENSQIAQKENYKVLLDIAWQQEIPPTKHAKPIHITGNKINGTITINRDRYFNIATNLILTEPSDYLDDIGSGDYAASIADNDYKSFQMLQTRRMRS